MCGRFTWRTPITILADQFAAIADVAFQPRFNVAPTQSIAAVRIRRRGKSGRCSRLLLATPERAV